MSASKWKPYPNYKRSDIPWISEIPAHWNEEKTKRVYKKMEREPISSDEVVTCFRDGEVTLRKNRRAIGYTESNKGIGYQRVRKGDLVIHEMDGFAGAIGVSDSDGKCTPVYSILTAKYDANPVYHSYVFREMAKREWIAALSKGIRQRSTEFRYATSSEQLLPMPSKFEQNEISVFLERINTNLDRQISILNSQIKLLEEKRTALITQAVTKGLKPNVSMKSTELEWYPEIPSHWNLRKVKNIASTMPSNVDKKNYDGQEEVRLANYVDVYKNDRITEDLDLMIASASENEISKFSLISGDLIITKDSEVWNDIAVPAFVPNTMEGVVCGYHLTLIRPNQAHVLGEFLFRTYQALGIRDQYYYNANGVTRYGLGSYWIDNGVVPVPPIDEQREIAEYIDGKLQIMNSMESNILSKIEKLKEFRISLISAAVTGKIDVRGHSNER